MVGDRNNAMRYRITFFTVLLFPSCLFAQETSTLVEARKVYSLKELWEQLPQGMKNIDDEFILSELNTWLNEKTKGRLLRISGDVSGWSRHGSGCVWLHTISKWQIRNFPVTIMGGLDAASTRELEKLRGDEQIALEGTIEKMKLWRHIGNYSSWGPWGYGYRYRYGSSLGYGANTHDSYDIQIDLTHCKVVP